MGWVHAIVFEANTPNAVVRGNDIRNLNAPVSDAAGVFFESNPSAKTRINFSLSAADKS